MPASVAMIQSAGLKSAVDFGVSARTVRLPVGLEGTGALGDDLARASEAAKR